MAFNLREWARWHQSLAEDAKRRGLREEEEFHRSVSATIIKMEAREEYNEKFLFEVARAVRNKLFRRTIREMQST